MTPGATTKVIGACCGLSAFAIAIVAGMAVDNPLDDVLTRAIVCLFGGNVVGWGVGMVCERTVQDGIASYKGARPVGKQSAAVGQPVPEGAGAVGAARSEGSVGA